jgi:6-phosphofructokinase 1
VAQIKGAYERKGYAIVVASEGIELPLNRDGTAPTDAFGHSSLGDKCVGERLAKAIEAATGIETRAAVARYIQRGGSPCAFDRILATRCGMRAATCVHHRDFGKMVALSGNQITVVPIAEAVGKLNTVPQEVFDEMRALFATED